MYKEIEASGWLMAQLWRWLLMRIIKAPNVTPHRRYHRIFRL